jgi:hypothetical protein
MCPHTDQRIRNADATGPDRPASQFLYECRGCCEYQALELEVHTLEKIRGAVTSFSGAPPAATSTAAVEEGLAGATNSGALSQTLGVPAGGGGSQPVPHMALDGERRAVSIDLGAPGEAAARSLARVSRIDLWCSVYAL